MTFQRLQKKKKKKKKKIDNIDEKRHLTVLIIIEELFGIKTCLLWVFHKRNAPISNSSSIIYYHYTHFEKKLTNIMLPYTLATAVAKR